jgi:FxsC-like protein
VHRGYVSADVTVPYFFLSYAHVPRGDVRDRGDPDLWVEELFSDLIEHVMQLTDLPWGTNPGFMDRETYTASDWSPRLVQALAACRVFVPLYSRRYFADERCGREWSYFTRRGNCGTRVPNAVEAIVPAIWEPVESRRLPAAARSVPLDYGDSEAYESLGFYGIMKLSRYRSDYQKAVYDLARRIVAAAEHFTVSKGLAADYDALENAFRMADRASPGDKLLRITVVAPQRDELPDGRYDDSYYGLSALGWNPYAPYSATPIGEYAAELARAFGFQVELGDINEHEAHLLYRGLPSAPQILIIDPWALLVPHSQHLLQRLDALETPWVQAVIPWNDGDSESQEAAGKLRAVLDISFRRKLTEIASTSAIAAYGVPDLAEFRETVPQLIRTAARRYLRNAPTFPPSGPAVERPRLKGLMPNFAG